MLGEFLSGECPIAQENRTRLTSRGATDDVAFRIKADFAANEPVRADLGNHRIDALRCGLREISHSPAHVEVHLQSCPGRLTVRVQRTEPASKA